MFSLRRPPLTHTTLTLCCRGHSDTHTHTHTHTHAARARQKNDRQPFEQHGNGFSPRCSERERESARARALPIWCVALESEGRPSSANQRSTAAVVGAPVSSQQLPCGPDSETSQPANAQRRRLSFPPPRASSQAADTHAGVNKLNDSRSKGLGKWGREHHYS